MNAGPFVTIDSLSLESDKATAHVTIRGVELHVGAETGAVALLAVRAKIEALLISFDSQAEKLLGPDWKVAT